MGFGTNIMKSLMFVFNGIVWVLGLVLFIVGIVVLVEGKNWNDIIDDKTVPVSVLLIVVGFIICVVGFLGCFGAIKQNSTMLLIYSIILAVIIIIQLVAGILAFIFSDEAEALVEKGLNKGLLEYGLKSAVTDNDSALTKGVNWLQENLRCCGIMGSEDWSRSANKAAWWISPSEGNHDNDVPDSCCKIEEGENMALCGANGASGASALINNRGCLTQGINWVKRYSMMMGICGILFLAFEFISIIMAFHIRKMN